MSKVRSPGTELWTWTLDFGPGPYREMIRPLDRSPISRDGNTPKSSTPQVLLFRSLTFAAAINVPYQLHLASETSRHNRFDSPLISFRSEVQQN